MNRPLSLNGWSYVEGNPITFMDPTGLFPCENCMQFRSNSLVRWCLANCCGSKWGNNSFTNGSYIPIKYADPGGRFAKEQIMTFLGAESYEEVLSYFETGGKYEGKWGWLAILRRADIGDKLNYYDITLDTYSTTNDYKSETNSAIFKYVDGGLYLQSDLTSELIPISSAILEDIGGSLTLVHYSGTTNSPIYRYQENTKFYFPDYAEFDPSKVDWFGVSIDALGLVGDIVLTGYGGRAVNGAELIRSMNTALDNTGFTYSLGQSAFDYSIFNALGLGADIIGYIGPPFVGDILGIGIGLAEGVPFSP